MAAPASGTPAGQLELPGTSGTPQSSGLLLGAWNHLERPQWLLRLLERPKGPLNDNMLWIVIIVLVLALALQEHVPYQLKRKGNVVKTYTEITSEIAGK